MRNRINGWAFEYNIQSFDTANFVHQQLAQLFVETKGVQLEDPLWVEIPKDSSDATYKEALKLDVSPDDTSMVFVLLPLGASQDLMT